MALLNKADQALIVDVLIDAGKKTNSVTCANEYLKLIKKVKQLELEYVEDYTMDQVFEEMDKLNIK